MEKKKTSEIKYSTDGIIPEAHRTINDIAKLTKDQRDLSNKGLLNREDAAYGHAARALVTGMLGVAGKSEDEQIKKMRRDAQDLISRYGEKILDVMRPELKEALGLDDS